MANFVLWGCGTHNTSNAMNGLQVTGNGEYYWYVSDENDYVLFVESDGVEISGIAEENTLIDINENVTNFKLCNLNQGSSEIEILISSRTGDSKKINLAFSGENIISKVDCSRELTLKGNSIEIIKGLDVTEDLYIMDCVISANHIEALSNLKIVGNSCVCLEASEAGDTYITEILSIGEELIIDLNKDGLIECIGNDELDAIVAYDGIQLTKNSTILIPENGNVMIDNDESFYSIYNSKNEIANHIRIIVSN